MNLKQEWDAIDADEAKLASLDDRKWALAERMAESGKTQMHLAQETGRHQSTVGRWLRAYREYAHAHNRPPFAEAIDWASGSNKRADLAGKALGKADDDTLESIVGSLPPEQVEKLVSKGTDRLVETARAHRAEHATEPTVRDLTGGEKFDPAEYWADTLVIRVNRNARELAHLVKRAGGLLFGTMPPAEAFDYLHEAERLIAEARAAAQEQVRDAVEV